MMLDCFVLQLRAPELEYHGLSPEVVLVVGVFPLAEERTGVGYGVEAEPECVRADDSAPHVVHFPPATPLAPHS